MSSTRSKVAAAAAALLIAVIVAGCGGDESSEAPPDNVLSGYREGPGGTLSSLSCKEWNEAGVDGRIEIVQALTGFLGGELVGEGIDGHGNTLEDEQAFELFDNYCDLELAENFILYKLYSHAAAFGAVDAGDAELPPPPDSRRDP